MYIKVTKTQKCEMEGPKSKKKNMIKVAIMPNIKPRDIVSHDLDLGTIQTPLKWNETKIYASPST